MHRTAPTRRHIRQPAEELKKLHVNQRSGPMLPTEGRATSRAHKNFHIKKTRKQKQLVWLGKKPPSCADFVHRGSYANNSPPTMQHARRKQTSREKLRVEQFPKPM
eukprot:INCI15480.1.p2 GENE.INCI15480.1~~INCI15480.1.p2  ORF type:complete len:106 (-),score=4.74 INCI15480.1:72-389(-)